MDARQNSEQEPEHTEMDEKPVEPLIQLSFEGIPVTKMASVLPAINLDMADGYPLGSHLKFEVEVRIANIRYEEGTGKSRGEFVRKHVLSPESVTLVKAFVPTPVATAPTGGLAGSEGLTDDEPDPGF